MGLDGGTKITRSDVLRGQSWRMTQADTSRSTRGGSVNQVFQEQQLDQQARRLILWSSCALSGLPLCPPLVADALGQLMNRQAVLEHLLAARSTVDDEAAQLRFNNQQRAAAGAWDHLKSMKDVLTVNLTPNPDLQQQQQQPGGGSSSTASRAQSSNSASAADAPLWVCPVTSLPCGGKQPFSALKTCGHVLSQKAIAAITTAERLCPVCETAFEENEVVMINGSQEHMDEVKAKLKAKAAAKTAAKAAKSNKKREQLCLEDAGSKESKLLLLQHPVAALPAADQAQEQGQLQQASKKKKAKHTA